MIPLPISSPDGPSGGVAHVPAGARLAFALRIPHLLFPNRYHDRGRAQGRPPEPTACTTWPSGWTASIAQRRLRQLERELLDGPFRAPLKLKLSHEL